MVAVVLAAVAAFASAAVRVEAAPARAAAPVVAPRAASARGTARTTVTGAVDVVYGPLLPTRPADAHGCKPLSACMGMMAALNTRFAYGTACLGGGGFQALMKLNQVIHQLNFILVHGCCATPLQFDNLLAAATGLLNEDSCPLPRPVPDLYVGILAYNWSISDGGVGSTTQTTTVSVSSTSTRPGVKGAATRAVEAPVVSGKAPSTTAVVPAPSTTVVAPAPSTATVATSAKDLELDLGECCVPYFEVEGLPYCCHERCWHMVEVLGIYFTLEECCAVGTNQQGFFVTCP